MAKDGKKWTAKQSQEFAEHLESRGMAIVPKSTLEAQNEFVRGVTESLNVADPENAGRKIGVVWSDDLALMKLICSSVLDLGRAQRAHDDALKAEPRNIGAIDDTRQKVYDARTRIEEIASHVSDPSKKARDLLKLDDAKISD